MSDLQTALVEALPCTHSIGDGCGWYDDGCSCCERDAAAILATQPMQDWLAAHDAIARELAEALRRIERHLRPERERDNGLLADAYDMATLALARFDAEYGDA